MLSEYDPELPFGDPEHQFMHPLELASYTWIEDDSLIIRDPVWGQHLIGTEPRDKVFLEMMHNPLVKRLMAIEQLTLGPVFSTIPNTGGFSRFEHAWGQLALARAMIESSPELRDLSEAEKFYLEARTFTSDFGTTAFSHMGDWSFQGFGGSEDLHDIELPRVMEVSGINDILRRHGYQPSRVIFPDIIDWIECSSPALNTDRTDYIVREGNRWLRRIADIDAVKGVHNYSVIDNRLVASTRHTAETLFRIQSIISSEHWQDPYQDTLLHIMQYLAKAAIVIDSNIAVHLMPFSHPRDQFYSVDSDFFRSFRYPHQVLDDVAKLATDLARRRRGVFVNHREGQLAHYFGDGGVRWQFPTPGIPYPDPVATNHLLDPLLEVIPADSPDDVNGFGENPNTLDIFMPHHKVRLIDPPFINEDGEIQTLTEADRRYADLTEQARATVAQSYVGRIALDKGFAADLKADMTEVDELFAEAMERERLDDDSLARLIDNAGSLAIPNRLIDLEPWWT